MNEWFHIFIYHSIYAAQVAVCIKVAQESYSGQDLFPQASNALTAGNVFTVKSSSCLLISKWRLLRTNSRHNFQSLMEVAQGRAWEDVKEWAQYKIICLVQVGPLTKANKSPKEVWWVGKVWDLSLRKRDLNFIYHSTEAILGPYPTGKQEMLELKKHMGRGSVGSKKPKKLHEDVDEEEEEKEGAGRQ